MKSIDEAILALLRHSYQRRLKVNGIPLHPDERTPDQQNTAALEFWATMLVVDAMTSITQSALEIFPMAFLI